MTYNKTQHRINAVVKLYGGLPSAIAEFQKKFPKVRFLELEQLTALEPKPEIKEKKTASGLVNDLDALMHKIDGLNSKIDLILQNTVKVGKKKHTWKTPFKECPVCKGLYQNLTKHYSQMHNPTERAKVLLRLEHARENRKDLRR